jgi:glycosyltransferase involved in cell wall biosynthesis/predicted O-methyltransferase YrrM
MSAVDDVRPRVALLSNTLGIGGTEKGLVSFATGLDRNRFRVEAVATDHDGPRRAELERAGIPVHVANGDEDRLVELLRDVDIAHVFRAGTPEPLVPRACRTARVGKVVETNIFGHVDRSPDEADFACHLFMSQMCLARYRTRIGARADSAFHRRHRVLRFPIEHEQLRAQAPPKAEARHRLGLDPERPVVGRVGREADLKWRDLLVDMVPHLLELAPETQVLFVGATGAKRARLKRLGLLERCRLVEPTADPTMLATFYAACDVFVSAAEIGESQGLGLGEAQALNVPVVTCSTPWADNAQVEFVEHGRSGWLASHPTSFAEAVADLLRDDERRRAFGAAGRADVERLLARAPLAEQLERLYLALLDGGEPHDWDPSPEQIAEFEADYPRRAAAEFRPLRPRERAEVRAMRMRERIRTARAALEERGVGALRERAGAALPRGLADRIARLEGGGALTTAAHRSYLTVHRVAEHAGLHVVRASYDSPIPIVRSLPEDVFSRESPLRAVDWRLDDQVRLLEHELAPYLSEFRPQADPSAQTGTFRLGNNTYDRVDAELLYALVRHLGPRRYVELGSGYSTLVAWEALQANAREGRGGELTCFDPYPSPHVLARSELAARVESVGAQNLPESVVGDLEASDVLFVDTSHTVKLGGDVNRIVLDLLPLAARGVVVHFHDVFLPADYSRGHVANAHYWTEQYLLQAFLMYNDAWQVLASAQALARGAPDLLRRLIPSFGPGVSPGALWLCRRGGPS